MKGLFRIEELQHEIVQLIKNADYRNYVYLTYRRVVNNKDIIVCYDSVDHVKENLSKLRGSLLI